MKVLFYTQSSYPSNILLISFLNPLRPSLHLHSFLFIPFSSPSFTSSLSYIHSLLSFVHPPHSLLKSSPSFITSSLFPFHTLLFSFIHILSLIHTFSPPFLLTFYVVRVVVCSQRSDSGRVYNDGGGKITQMVHGTTEWLIGVVEPETRINQPKWARSSTRANLISSAGDTTSGYRSRSQVRTIYYTVDECLVSRQCLEIVLLSLVYCDVTWRSRRVEVSAILVTDDVDWFQCEIPMSYGLTVVMGTGSPIVTNVNMCEGLNTRHQSYDNNIAFEDIHFIDARWVCFKLSKQECCCLSVCCCLLSEIKKYLHSW